MEYIQLYFAALLELFNEMSPYLLLGFLIAGILHIYFPKEKVNRFMGKANLGSVVKAALLGVPLPLCSCGVIPTGISFHKNGASKGAAVSFLISTPQTGVDSILVTYSMLGLPFALIRPVIAFVTGILGGVLTNTVEKNVDAEPVSNIADNQKNMTASEKFIEMFRYAFVEFMQDISKWLVIGLLAAALIDIIIPDNFFTQYLGNEFLSMLFILAASVPLYVCATGSVPIAAVLMAKGISAGAAFVFLMAGPATNIATITVIGKVMGRKTLATYLFSIISGALVAGVAINAFLPAEWFTPLCLDHLGHAGHESHLLPYWLKLTSTIVLILLIINGYIQKHRNGEHNHDALIAENNALNFKKVKVSGMTCNHCKANVETNVAKIEGITTVNANFTTSEVYIYGNKIELMQVKKTVEDLGYSYEGEL